MKKEKSILRSQRGMTLVEITIVLIILGGLIAILAPNLIGELGKSKVKTAKIQMSQLGAALDRFNLDCNFYPTSEQGLESLLTAPSNCRNWGPEPYAKSNMIVDPWGNEFIYERNSSTSYILISLGADGEEGGSGIDADISSDDKRDVADN